MELTNTRSVQRWTYCGLHHLAWHVGYLERERQEKLKKQRKKEKTGGVHKRNEISARLCSRKKEESSRRAQWDVSKQCTALCNLTLDRACMMPAWSEPLAWCKKDAQMQPDAARKANLT